MLRLRGEKEKGSEFYMETVVINGFMRVVAHDVCLLSKTSDIYREIAGYLINLKMD